MRICYFTNVYPAPSHTTMRREIFALEALGQDVVRVAARPFRGHLVEAADQREAARTHYTALSVPIAVQCLFGAAWRRPVCFVRALRDVVRVGSQSKRGIVKYLMYLGEASVLLHLARGCDHIHANFGNATSIAVLCRVLGGPKVSLRIHGPEEFDTFTSVEWAWKVGCAAFVAPISAYGADKVGEAVGERNRGKLRMLRCGVDVPLIDLALAPLPGCLHLVCVARLEPRKGHDVLLSAVAMLQRAGLPVTLTLVGEGSLRKLLEQRAQRLLKRGSVEFAGWLNGEGAQAAMRSARVVVLPSLAEGLPIVLMEALAIGRAVVATRVAGVPELVIPGQTGWLVDAGDAEALAAALREALLAPDEVLAAAAVAGRVLITEKHNTMPLMRQLIAYMQAPCRSNRRRRRLWPSQGATIIDASGASGRAHSLRGRDPSWTLTNWFKPFRRSTPKTPFAPD